jgi:hypothetical protein
MFPSNVPQSIPIKFLFNVGFVDVFFGKNFLDENRFGKVNLI